MKKILVTCLILFSIPVFSQKTDTLTLVLCQQQAIENYPLIKQKDLLSASADLRIKNLNTSYFPQLSLSGQATYQSAVTQIPQFSPLFQVPSMNKDQYKVTLDLNQTIWDGGLTSAQKKLETSELQSDKLSVDVELAKIKTQINLIFFNILLDQQNQKVLSSIQADLQSRLKKMEAGIKDEVVLQSSADVLKAEYIKTEQQMIELKEAKQTAIKMLAEFINKPIAEDAVFKLPETDASIVVYDNKRLEMQLFDFQMNKLDVSKKLSTVKTMPKFYAFGQGGYGRPGFNMLSNNFDFFYIFGAKLSWNITGFYQTGREKQIIDIQKNLLQAQKETFDKNLKISSQKDMDDITKFQQLIENDNEIVRLRENITHSASVQLDNGIITATEYVTELNNEIQARFNMELHKIQLQMAKLNYLNAMGKL
ncbi:MAG: TolC family protein [Bacteroidota bacterium]